VAGTPTQAGSFNFVVTATDSAHPALAGTLAFSLKINDSPIIIAPATLPLGIAGFQYQGFSFSATGGSPPYSWRSSGSLPPGLQFGSDGRVTGTPTQAGLYSFSVSATDSANPPVNGPPLATNITINAIVALPSMNVARKEHTATLLADGRVLIAGGYPNFATAELYETAQHGFAAVADMNYGRQAHTATLLPNSGFVLVAGGQANGGAPFSAAELFMPGPATFTSIKPMTTARAFFTATVLATGQVLIAGGDTAGNTAEIFDPTTQMFSATGTMNQARSRHAAVLLADGRVLIIGGDVAGNTAEIFSPGTGQFSPTGSMQQARTQFTATLMSNGNVLITGGSWAGTPLASTETYESSAGKFVAGQPLHYVRFAHSATALPDGTVMIAGGAEQFVHMYECQSPLYFYSATSTLESFDPATGQFAVFPAADALTVPRYSHTATLLVSGEVLVTGGTTIVKEHCGINQFLMGEFPVTSDTAQLVL
jgi:hypothetical protein